MQMNPLTNSLMIHLICCMFPFICCWHSTHIIYNSTRGMLYLSMLFYANLNLLALHKENLSSFFMQYYGSCLLSPQSHSSTQIHINYLKAQIFPDLSQNLPVPSAIVPSYNMDLTITNSCLTVVCICLLIFLLIVSYQSHHIMLSPF